jgi:hypothetical protein
MLLSRSIGGDDEAQSLDTNGIREWRSIITLIVFVLTSELHGTHCSFDVIG